MAAIDWITNLDPVAILPVAANRAIGNIAARIGGLIALIRRAGDAIVAGRRARLAHAGNTGFRSVAVLTIAAGVVVVGNRLAPHPKDAAPIGARIRIRAREIIGEMNTAVGVGVGVPRIAVIDSAWDIVAALCVGGALTIAAHVGTHDARCGCVLGSVGLVRRFDAPGGRGVPGNDDGESRSGRTAITDARVDALVRFKLDAE